MIRRSEYELMFIAHPSLDGEEGVPALTERVQGWIEGIGGEITYSDIWGRRRLAYPIRKQKEGTYVLLRAMLPRQSLGDLERELKLTEEILRYLIVRAESPLPPKRGTRTTSRQPEPSPEPEVEPEPEVAEEATLDAVAEEHEEEPEEVDEEAEAEEEAAAEEDEGEGEDEEDEDAEEAAAEEDEGEEEDEEDEDEEEEEEDE